MRAEVGLADYRQVDLSPVRSQDLLTAAAHPIKGACISKLRRLK